MSTSAAQRIHICTVFDLNNLSLHCFMHSLCCSLQVPPCLDQCEDEGFQSASNLTPDSQSEPSPIPDFDIWEALRTFEPGRRRCWESVGW